MEVVAKCLTGWNGKMSREARWGTGLMGFGHGQTGSSGPRVAVRRILEIPFQGAATGIQEEIPD